MSIDTSLLAANYIQTRLTGLSHIDAESAVTKEINDNNGDIQTLIWYADADGDGFGIESLQTESCTRPEGYAENIGDCNDENAEINPEVQEICDGIDNNCNTTVDDDENGWLQSSGTYFYNDLDADGFGGPGYAEVACSGRDGMVDNIDDCNDSDFRINPLASEICDDIDNDCDRLIDDEDDSLEVANTFYADGIDLF